MKGRLLLIKAHFTGAGGPSVDPLSPQIILSEGRDRLEELAILYLAKNNDRTVSCTLCGKICRDTDNAKNHLEAKHFPSETGYSCQLCPKICKTKNALACHMSQNHRGMR